MSTAAVEAAPEPAAADAPARTFGLAFKRAIAVVRRLRGRDTHRPGELSYAQYGLLFGLAEHRQLTTTELASLAGVAPSTATKMLDRLVEIELVERVRSELDRRVVLVALTLRGAKIVAARRARYDELWDTALAGFSDQQLAGATVVLERVIAMFEEIESAHDDTATEHAET
jgi:DNA-binding MarR family transcriptional regulator